MEIQKIETFNSEQISQRVITIELGKVEDWQGFSGASAMVSVDRYNAGNRCISSSGRQLFCCLEALETYLGEWVTQDARIYDHFTS